MFVYDFVGVLFRMPTKGLIADIAAFKHPCADIEAFKHPWHGTAPNGGTGRDGTRDRLTGVYTRHLNDRNV